MPSRINVPQNEIDSIINLYDEGKSVLSISKMVTYSYDIVNRVIRESGRLIRGNRIYAKKYDCDSKYFNDIDTEEKAYWLGFIYADGTITFNGSYNQLSIALKSEDKGHLQKFAKSMNSNNPVLDYTNSQFNKDYSKIVLRNEEICQDLINLGAVKNKSLVLKFPKTLKTNLIRHFIRGYFDGDGCITYINHKKRLVNVYQLKIVGTYEMLYELYNIFGLKSKFEFDKTKEVNNYTLEFGGNRQVERVMDYMYEDSIIYLDRKYERYMMLKQDRAEFGKRF